jgi:SOS response regulatory protein OraA/RecX
MENCRYLAEKKYGGGNPPGDRKSRQALISYLRNKGFNWEYISAVVPIPAEENNFE